MKSRVKIICQGIVQGIGFRPFVYRLAKNLDLVGFVRNQGDAGVLIIAEGEKKNLEVLIKKLQEEKPYLAKYEDFQVTWLKFTNQYNDFSIEKSSSSKIGGISYLPPDISICEDCLNDMKNENDQRFHYPFTSCAICGPRFTTITSLPYDRLNTTMIDFPLCENCKHEYENPLDRRYHAQTTCCTDCGPKLTIYTNDGEIYPTINIYEDLAKLIEEGNIVGIKGIGGTHLASSALLDDTILKLRSKKGKRKYKPFALISRNLTNISSFAEISTIEKELLLSFRKPIVLLDKRNPFPLSSWISPNLHNVGVMLPYSGIHSLLLEKIKDPAIILTSANPSDIPMFIENVEIKSKLKDFADYIVLHNRRIFQRADDSVIRITNNNPVLIRRSRGWVPEPINLPFSLKNEIALGVGPLLTSTAAISLKDRCFPTQYIGDVNTIETLDFLDTSIQHLKSLLGIEAFTAIGHDLHPSFLSTELARDYSKKYTVDLLGIQHHYAHAISLMIDNNVGIEDDIIAIVADGVGYGEDGKIWGGEILHTSYFNYKRIGHLEEQPMIGGDRATYFPIRILAGILSKKFTLEELLKILEENYLNSLPDFKNEIQVILMQLKNKLNISYTTSTGRILAAISTMLHACYERTYEGEPAIVLESLAHYGKPDKIQFNLPLLKDNIINTTALVEQTYNKFISGVKPADLALAVHLEIAKQFATIAIDYAKANSIKKIGFTGGVAYNEFITKIISKYVKDAGLVFLAHKALPCGDGAISVGQSIKAVIAKI